MHTIRPAVVAGSFYSGHSQTLEETIHTLLSNVANNQPAMQSKENLPNKLYHPRQF